MAKTRIIPKARKNAKTAKRVKRILIGTLRIRAKGIRTVEKTNRSWKASASLPSAIEVAKLFKAHNNLKLLEDKKDPRFLKGQLSPDGKCQGARINVLPDGRKLDKAYSLFASQLTVHDEASNEHWDVMYYNPCGTYTHLYLLRKKERALKRKYDDVRRFARLYPKLMRKLNSALRDQDDQLAVPMYTLMKTYMRVGNETYFKAHGHKGLTTLKKSDIKVSGRTVTFKYKGKDGVPRNIIHEFPKAYVKRLVKTLKPLKKSAFVFVKRSTGHPLRDTDFKDAFKRYCGIAFYPQMVRSFYATRKAAEFAKTHRSATKDEVRRLFLSIAGVLGHRKYSKKDKQWKESYNVTTHYYIRPDVVERINSLVKK